MGLVAEMLRPEHLALAGVATVFYMVGLAFYRLYLHPLADIPGPLLARITSFDAAWHAWKGDSHMVLYNAHRKYGDFVRFTPNFVSVNTAEGLKDIYSHGRNVQKAKFYSVMPPYPHAFDTHTVIDKSLHGRKRRVLSQGFSDAALRSMEDNVLTHVRIFCRNLISNSPDKDNCAGIKLTVPKRTDQSSSPPRNMSFWSNWLTFDVIADLGFGKSFGMLEREETRFWPILIDYAIHRHAIAGISLFVHKTGLGSLLFPKIAEGQKTFVAHSRKSAEERIALGKASRKDFFYHLLDARDPVTGNGYTASELWSESNLLIAAGSHTPSTALTAAFFYLTTNPECMVKLRKEVDSRFTSLEQIKSGPELNSCSYLRACLDESMRLSPPVPTTLPREVLPGGAMISGRFFPEGTDIGTPAFTLSTNEKYFSNPLKFIPERWDASISGAETVAKAASAFAPFSLGPRACVGRSLAYMEMLTTLARVLYLYDMKYIGGGVDENFPEHCLYKVVDHHTALGDRGGPWVTFKLREGKQVPV